MSRESRCGKKRFGDGALCRSRAVGLDFLQAFRASWVPGMVGHFTIRALSLNGDPSLVLGDAVLSDMPTTAHPTARRRSANRLVMSEPVAVIAPHRLGVVFGDWEGAPDAKINFFGHWAQEGDQDTLGVLSRFSFAATGLLNVI